MFIAYIQDHVKQSCFMKKKKLMTRQNISTSFPIKPWLVVVA